MCGESGVWAGYRVEGAVGQSLANIAPEDIHRC